MNRKKYKIGIDIGGTNTDIVLVDCNSAIAAHAKTSTTLQVHHGVKTALKMIMEETKISCDDVQGIFLGTTQIANAIHQRHDLHRVGVIRIAGNHPNSLPSCYAWPEDLKKTLVDTVTIDGGFECDGSPITPINTAQIRSAISALLKKKMESLAVIGVFAAINPRQELLVKEIAQEMTKGELPISLSHQIGGTGFIERENSTILNASLKRVMTNVFKSLTSTCTELGLACPLWITQNNGSILDLSQASEYPVLTISAGPTNSFIGGMKVAQMENAIIIDVGGTSTDIGLVNKGVPRRCLNNSKIGGITLNFSMPDVYSIAMGGGSHIDINKESIEIGPQSCANSFLTQSVAFGGKQLTLTDIALALGYFEMPGARIKNIKLSHRGCKTVINEAVRKIYELISKIGPEELQLPIVLIGGGASLFPKNLLDGRFIIPPYAHVANAYGAALAEISATVDTVVSLDERQKVLEMLQEQAIQATIERGADFKTVKVVDVNIIPYHYMPNRLARVIVRASGAQASKPN
ncbi:MAG TPA: hydantoinase/oxoprolinase family protein [Parachlamydiaceae bacterium]|nr:hydantoinase/oxoprolinase family protein [Parachlamydiaceae bacterium]